jgi:GNAT superfamily N-acetyltransferase
MHDEPREWTRGEFLISTDRQRLDYDVVYEFISTSYWARGMPRATFERAIENSLIFGVYQGREPVGFGRVITDRATYAYLSDVFVLESYRKRGLSKWLMECILAHPDLQGLRRFALFTRDAQGLYARYGFDAPRSPSTYLERWTPNVYARSET